MPAIGFGRPVAAGSTLNNGVLASFNADESTGSNLIDSGPNGYDFTQHNSPTQEVGGAPDGSDSRFLTAADSERFTRNQSELQFSNGNITWGGWWYIDSSLPASDNTFAASYRTATDQRAWILMYDQSQAEFAFWTFADGTGTGLVTVGSGITPAADTWYGVLCWFDAVNDEIAISINDETPVTAAQTAVHASTHDIEIGSRLNGSTFHNGGVWNLWAWDRILSAAERTEWYNSGSGVLYPA